MQVAPSVSPLLRNYSLSGEPGATTYRVSAKREANGVGSSFIHNQVNVGDVLEVSAPRGSFTLQSSETPIVLVSAGIGATPVLAMLHSLAAAGSQREIWWLYGARSGRQHPFAEESRDLLKSLVRGRRHIAYSKPEPEDQLGENYDSVGHIDASLLERLGLPRSVDFYVCGPSSFIPDFSEGVKSRGVNPAQIRSEVFGPEGSMTPGIKWSGHLGVHLPSGAPGRGPQVSFTRSGLNVAWDKRFSSLLELAEGCDVPVKWSCRTGVCHTCESALIGGTVTYQPDPLDPPAQGSVLICCSQPASNVEIDL